MSPQPVESPDTMRMVGAIIHALGGRVTVDASDVQEMEDFTITRTYDPTRKATTFSVDRIERHGVVVSVLDAPKRELLVRFGPGRTDTCQAMAVVGAFTPQGAPVVLEKHGPRWWARAARNDEDVRLAREALRVVLYSAEPDSHTAADATGEPG